MTLHAFIDESRRGNRYLMAVVMVTPPQLTPLRQQMRRLLMPGERELHFKKEKEPRKRSLAQQVARLHFETAIYVAPWNRSDEPARQACLARITHDLIMRDAQLMVLDSRNSWDGNDRDFHDRSTLQRILDKQPRGGHLVFQHVDSTAEALLWLADVVAWCWGAGGAWRQKIGPVVTETASVPLDSAKPGRRPSGRKTGFTS